MPYTPYIGYIVTCSLYIQRPYMYSEDSAYGWLNKLNSVCVCITHVKLYIIGFGNPMTRCVPGVIDGRLKLVLLEREPSRRCSGFSFSIRKKKHFLLLYC